MVEKEHLQNKQAEETAVHPLPVLMFVLPRLIWEVDH